MQDMILIQLGLKTCAHNLHSHAKSADKMTDGINCRTAKKIWAALPLGKEPGYQ
jgi:hypothetical protein